MKNFAGTAEHQAYLSRFDYIFSKEYYLRTHILQLNETFSVAIEQYHHGYSVSPKSGYSIACQQYELRDAAGNALFRVRFSFGRSFCELIHHSNGNDYFICGQDLTDFSVYNINQRLEYCYFSGNLCFNGKHADDYHGFWYITNLIYNPDNNILIVNGQCTMNGCMSVACDFKSPDILPFKSKSLHVFCDDCFTTIEFKEGGILLGIGEDEYYEKQVSEKELLDYLNS